VNVLPSITILTFVSLPQLMNLMKFAQKKGENYCVTWLTDGKSFVISNPDEFTRQILPKYFKATKFSSFTRKLYRWGFRQVNRGIGPDDPIIFGNEYFQRDDAELMAKMRSVTAASTRKTEVSSMQMLAQKRALDCIEADRDHKRVLLDQIMQQQKSSHFQNPSIFAQGGMNLTNVLRPGLGLGGNGGYGGGNGGYGGMNMNQGNGLKPFEQMMGQQFQPSHPLMNAFPSMQQGNMNGNGNGHPNPASTAEIVNAAINALRYAP
jgi:hypothetical protein